MANAPDDQPVADAELSALFQPLERSRRVVLAVSGGPDSMALMYLVSRWTLAHDRVMGSLVVTVDHGLRPEAAAEAVQVGIAAEALHLRHVTLRWVGEKPVSDIQNACRVARYRLLADAARTDGADTLVTAHTQDDQAETFLLALARGSGVYGLAGMPAERDLAGIRLVRPLLGLPKSRLIATLRAAGVSWVEDPSNLNDRFRRVGMRKAAPALAAIGLTAPVLADTADRLARASSALDHYADRLIASALVVHPGGYVDIDVAKWGNEPQEVALRALARVLRAVTGAPYGPRLQRLESLLADILSAARSGARLTRTLAGVTAVLPAAGQGSAPPRLWLFAEAGRAGFHVETLVPGQTLDWDRRIRITLSPRAPDGLVVRALGRSAGRLLQDCAIAGIPRAALATLASVWRDEDLVTVVGMRAEPRWPDQAVVSAVALVGERLASRAQ